MEKNFIVVSLKEEASFFKELSAAADHYISLDEESKALYEIKKNRFVSPIYITDEYGTVKHQTLRMKATDAVYSMEEL